jgi:hypothetical protein
VAFDGRAAFAFAVFDRSLAQSEAWIATARTPRPSTSDDWIVHPVFDTPRTIETPALIVDGARFAMAFGTVDGIGRDTERRSQHLALSSSFEPASDADWRVVTIDLARGGAADILRDGSHLVIAYGHRDPESGIHSVFVASTIEPHPSGPESFVARELDRTSLEATPRLLDVLGDIGILYRQSPANPLVFRSTDEI